MTEALDLLPNLQSAQETVEFFDKCRTFHIDGQMWCPACKLKNRFTVKPELLTANGDFFNALKNRSPTLTNSGVSGPFWRPVAQKFGSLGGSQFRFTCTRCQSKALALFRVQNKVIVVSIFFDAQASIATVNTPASVAYYLEQVSLCQSVNAYSATLAMYRTALDAILFNAGYQEGMIGSKIAALERDISAGRGPSWVRTLSTPYLKVIKDLGNSSLHISNEGLEEERAINDDLIQEVELAIHALLDEAYEREAREKARLEKLQAVSRRKSGKNVE